MGNILKLCVFLLCFETGFTLQCAKCQLYRNGACIGNRETCTAQGGEMCMIRRVWATHIENMQGAETKCMDSCKTEEKNFENLTIYTYCCNNADFCNDVNLPIVMT
ncbi:prostate and testis expressed protein 3-like [Arvicanthis niloticus]|uniref:prostate and testis expressed protein 3-like n=1 Tax=Arvicanthis niloticus TaxID=61156 RepID=UPI00402B6C3B